ncbi:hypothetical protein ADK57_22740 [Streptomyces sp. MMG1533]|uniref:hypothetical protein n=1 Tax=Streptomyces sp. MMG1533 TaxID=1415546 RepID=UPI0006AFE80D|nr:hypothetical protein [Streptomyces sp. MMG1533]KOU63142.1 hypothetical protein ADK57_22740 [Streptomyces sp. MMG1533]
MTVEPHRLVHSPRRPPRRLQALETSGTLFHDVDLPAERLGHHLPNATFWLRVAPAHPERAGEEPDRHDQVAFAGATSGDHNLTAIVVCRDADDFCRQRPYKREAVSRVQREGVGLGKERPTPTRSQPLTAVRGG